MPRPSHPSSSQVRHRRVGCQFGILWFLLNSSILSVFLWLLDTTRDPSTFVNLITFISGGMILGLTQGFLVRKYLPNRSKITCWILATLIGWFLSFCLILAAILLLVLFGIAFAGSHSISVAERHGVILNVYLLIAIGGGIGGGVTGLLQFLIIKKNVRAAGLWLVATTVSGALNGVIYSLYFLEFYDSYDPVGSNFHLIVVSGIAGIVYGLITSSAMTLMLQKTMDDGS